MWVISLSTHLLCWFGLGVGLAKVATELDRGRAARRAYMQAEGRARPCLPATEAAAMREERNIVGVILLQIIKLSLWRNEIANNRKLLCGAPHRAGNFSRNLPN